MTAPAEILFAQHLASNEKVHRDRALRKLQKYLFNHSSLPNGGFNETELLKIWKGLHYCMWMQDKPLIQEELCDSIANLVHSFNNAHTGFLFIKTFYMTECREWNSIDKWRMDKFLMLLRNMLTQTFEFLKNKKWSDKLVRKFLGFISEYILHDHRHDTSPDGVRFHLADIYLTELTKVSAGQLGPKQTIIFIEPWINMLKQINSKTLRAFVIKNVFGEIIQQSPAVVGRPRKKGNSKLRVNYELLAEKLLDAGSLEECTSVNRPPIYNLVKNFRDVAEGKLPYVTEDESEEEEIPDLGEDDIERAVERLAEFKDQMQQENRDEKVNMKKRKKGSIDVDEAYGSESSGDEGKVDTHVTKRPSAEEVALKKRKREHKEKKGGVLSRKLQQILKAERDFIHDMQDPSDDELGEGEEDDDDDAELSDEGDDLLYADDDDEISVEMEMVEEQSQKLKASKKKVGDNQPSTTKEVLHASKGRKKTTGTAVKEETVAFNTEPVADSPTISTKKKSNKRSKKKPKKTAPSTPEFDIEEFPEVEDMPEVSELVPVTVSSTISPIATGVTKSTNKLAGKGSRSKTNTNNNNTKKSTQADKASEQFAEFVPTTGVKAKYFKKAMSNSTSPATPNVADRTPPVTRSQKRLSFGKNSSVKKSAVKLRGSMSYDPTKTPEQGILRVNAIEPGTVIRVGKQATKKNTLNNSKFAHQMTAMDFF